MTAGAQCGGRIRLVAGVRCSAEGRHHQLWNGVSSDADGACLAR